MPRHPGTDRCVLSSALRFPIPDRTLYTVENTRLRRESRKHDLAETSSSTASDGKNPSRLERSTACAPLSAFPLYWTPSDTSFSLCRARPNRPPRNSFKSLRTQAHPGTQPNPTATKCRMQPHRHVPHILQARPKTRPNTGAPTVMHSVPGPNWP